MKLSDTQGVPPSTAALATMRAAQSPLATAMIVLALLAVFCVLSLSRALVLPVVLALLFQLLLSPLVRFLLRRGLPRPLGAALVVGIALLATSYGVLQLATPAFDAMRTVPEALHQLSHATEDLLRPMQEVTEVTESVEALTDVGSDPEEDFVSLRQPSLIETLFSSAREALSTFGLSLVLLYFLLAVDHTFLAKLIDVAFSFEGDQALSVVQGIERQISRYLVTISLINIGLGLAVGLAMWILGLQNFILWGLMAALLNFVPYVGAIVGAAVVGLGALGALESPERALLAAAIYMALSALEGTLVTPTLLGRSLTLSPVAVFIWLMLWNFVWGVPGMLIAVPLLVALTIFCNNVPSLAALAQLLKR